MTAKTQKMTLDQALLELLRGDARLSVSDLARKLGVARSTIQGRMERLEKSGVIRGYTIELGDSVRHPVRAHALIAVDPQQQAIVERKLKHVRAVKTLLSVSGAHDLIAMLAAESTEALDTALDELRSCPGVKSTTTSVVLSQRFAR